MGSWEFTGGVHSEQSYQERPHGGGGLSPEGDKVPHSTQREENEQSTHRGACVHGKAAPAGESRWVHGRLSRNKSIGMWFRVIFEGP